MISPEMIEELKALLARTFKQVVHVEIAGENPVENGDGPLLHIDRGLWGLWSGDVEVERPSILGTKTETVKGFWVEAYVSVSNWPHAPDDTDVTDERGHERWEDALADLFGRIAADSVTNHFDAKADAAFDLELDRFDREIEDMKARGEW